MMEAANTSETSVNFYQTTRRYNPEYSHLHICRRVQVLLINIPLYITVLFLLNCFDLNKIGRDFMDTLYNISNMLYPSAYSNNTMKYSLAMRRFYKE
jgi:hypothetical protein